MPPALVSSQQSHAWNEAGLLNASVTISSVSSFPLAPARCPWLPWTLGILEFSVPEDLALLLGAGGAPTASRLCVVEPMPTSVCPELPGLLTGALPDPFELEHPSLKGASLVELVSPSPRAWQNTELMTDLPHSR